MCQHQYVSNILWISLLSVYVTWIKLAHILFCICYSWNAMKLYDIHAKFRTIKFCTTCREYPGSRIFIIVILYLQSFPSSATTLHFEFYVENKDEKGSKKVCYFSINNFFLRHINKLCNAMVYFFQKLHYSIFLLTEYCKHNNFHTYGEFG